MPEPGRDELESLYREVVLDHYRDPRNRSALPHCDGEALVSNPVCGDQVRVQVALEDGRIAQVSARARGCSIAVAAGSVMTELVAGLNPDQARALAAQLEVLVSGESAPTAATAPAAPPALLPFARVADLPSRQRCATLAWEALAEALANASEEEPQEPPLSR